MALVAIYNVHNTLIFSYSVREEEARESLTEIGFTFNDNGTCTDDDGCMAYIYTK